MERLLDVLILPTRDKRDKKERATMHNMPNSFSDIFFTTKCLNSINRRAKITPYVR